MSPLSAKNLSIVEAEVALALARVYAKSEKNNFYVELIESLEKEIEEKYDEKKIKG